MLRFVSLREIAFEQLPQGRRSPVHIHLTGAEVHAARHRAVDTAQVDHQFAVHVKPEIIVPGELEDDVMPPGIQTAGGLGETGFKLHGEITVHFIISVCYGVQCLVLSRVAVIQLAGKIIQVLSVDRGENAREQIIVREELAVLQRRFIASGIVGAQLFVNLEVFAIQTRKVLCAVIHEVAAGTIDALDEQVVHLLRAGAMMIQFCQRASLCSRIPVRSQVRGQKPLVQCCSHTAITASQEIAHIPVMIIPVLKVDHLHGDAVLGVIHGGNQRQVIIHIHILHDGEVEIHRLRLGAGNDPTVFDLQAHIGIIVFIPGQDRGVVFAVPPAVQVDADGII